MRRPRFARAGPLLVLLAACGAVLPAAALVAIPPYEARAIDLTHTLAAQELSALRTQLETFETRKGPQLAVLMLPTTAPEAIEQFSMRLAEAWMPGRAAVDDGAIFIIAKDDRRMRIEVGYGLEGALTDATAKRIIDEVVTPYFKRGEFYAGIDAGVGRIIRVIDGEPLPPPLDKRETSNRDSDLYLFFVFVAFVGGRLARSIFGRIRGAAVIAFVSAAVAWFVTHLLLIAAVAGILAGFFALLPDSAGGGRWSSGSRGGGWSGGGGFGGGGGGGFGGGGASGGW